MRFMMKLTVVATLGLLFFTGCTSNRIEKKLGPAESVTYLISSIAEGNGFEALAFLPKSWRADLNRAY